MKHSGRLGANLRAEERVEGVDGPPPFPLAPYVKSFQGRGAMMTPEAWIALSVAISSTVVSLIGGAWIVAWHLSAVKREVLALNQRVDRMRDEAKAKSADMQEKFKKFFDFFDTRPCDLHHVSLENCNQRVEELSRRTGWLERTVDRCVECRKAHDSITKEGVTGP